MNVYVASSTDGAGPDKAGRPPVFFLLLACDVFRHRTRGTIYKHGRQGDVAVAAAG